MIKRFILDDASAPTGKMDCYIVSSSRDEFLSIVDHLAVSDWVGRIIYYDVLQNGGIDLLINPSGNETQPYELRFSRAVSWGEARLCSGRVLAEEVRNAFATYPLRDGTKPDEGLVKVAPAIAPSLREKPVGQLALF